MRRTKILSILTATAVALSAATASLAAVSAFANEVINEGEMGQNNGTININTATGEIQVNAEEGNVILNEGVIDINDGTIGTNDGTVEINDIGVIKLNDKGTVETNKASIEKNNGAVDRNWFGGVVDTNSGTVNSNLGTVNNTETGKVNYNMECATTAGGYVGMNFGNVTGDATVNENRSGGTVGENVTVMHQLWNIFIDRLSADSKWSSLETRAKITELTNSAGCKGEMPIAGPSIAGYINDEWTCDETGTPDQYEFVVEDSSYHENENFSYIIALKDGYTLEWAEETNRNCSFEQDATGKYILTNVKGDLSFKIIFTGTTEENHTLPVVTPEDVVVPNNNGTYDIVNPEGEVVATVEPVTPTTPVITPLETYETPTVKADDVNAVAMNAEGSAKGVSIANLVLSTKESNELIKKDFAAAVEAVIKDVEIIAALGDAKVDVSKAQVLTSAFVACTKSGMVTINVKGKKFTQNDVVLAVINGKVVRATINANGLISFPMTDATATVSLISF